MQIVATDDELLDGLRKVLQSPINRLVRKPYAYQSSFALEELEIVKADGTQIDLIFKDLGRERLLEDARTLRPDFVYNPLREIRTYSDLLPRLKVGTASFYGAVVDEPIGKYWLFLERVPGRELYQIGELDVWRAAARWLAQLHRRWAAMEPGFGDTAPLLRYTPEYCNRWLQRAELTFDISRGRGQIEFSLLARHYEKAVERIAEMPATFLHGEFYPSNILIDTRKAAVRVCPVDWEMAALGPPAMDLAALTSGQWSDEQRNSLVTAYVSAFSEWNGSVDMVELQRDLECCRLYIAVQWLGWFQRQKPYGPHRQDWLAEAIRAAFSWGCRL